MHGVPRAARSGIVRKTNVEGPMKSWKEAFSRPSTCSVFIAHAGKFRDERRGTEYYGLCIAAGEGCRDGWNDFVAEPSSVLLTHRANPRLTEKSRNTGDSCNAQGILD